MTIAGRIVLLRSRLGLSQKLFSEILGKSVGYINRIENGHSPVSKEIVSSITAAFAIPMDWLETGEGTLIVESLGDRIKRARKAREYTQEELAGELGISRNSIGMMERGSIRPSDETITSLCNRLWIDQRWLLTGTGKMEKQELTLLYNLLRRDPAVRSHIRSFIDHLDRPQYIHEEKEEAIKTEMVPSWGINDSEEAKRFFDHYHIPYREENGKLLVCKSRTIDWECWQEVEDRCCQAKLSHLTDHPATFVTAEGDTIITFAPYDVEEANLSWIEKSPYNFYGFGTSMFVVRC